ncbi:hypothetical protein PHLCEN_2v10088 [Hermanssonia centrifuga]|uniref:HMA domain-containing protein n=1 Tax=Hermanssonia centrifuga TaxID=98765 RepID=A0A2R6NNV4_9APHY|nr:hypothetical protein PHLCEN_2v10088 [Hermanssonia centrifuga]
MTCGGCSGAVTRVLAKAEGVSSYDVSLEKQEVLVTGTIAYDELYAKIAKTGKQDSCRYEDMVKMGGVYFYSSLMFPQDNAKDWTPWQVGA